MAQHRTSIQADFAKRAASWLLALLLVLGQGFTPSAAQPGGSPLITAADICVVGHNGAVPDGGPSFADHGCCVLHCCAAAAALAPSGPALADQTRPHYLRAQPQHGGALAAHHSAHHSPRAPPFLSSLA